MTLPRMKSGTGKVHATFKLAHYDCILIEEPEATGPIKYFFMLIVSERGLESPKIVVTCEHNSLQKEIVKLTNLPNLGNPPLAYICYFDADGNHFIQEPLNETPEIDTFKTRAFEIVKLKLNINESPVLIAADDIKILSNNLIKNVLLKKSRILISIFIAALIGLGFVLVKNLIKPNNYNDCILANMQGLSSDFAARQIKHACLKKFAKKITYKLVVFREQSYRFPNDATDKEIKDILLKTYNSPKDIVDAMATIREDTEYVLE